METSKNSNEEVIMIPLQTANLRKQLIWLSLIESICVILLIAMIFLTVFSFNNLNNPIWNYFLVIVVIIEISATFILLLVSANGMWLVFLIIRRLSLQEPVLIISGAGIIVSDLLRNQFLPWQEISLISRNTWRNSFPSLSIEYLAISLRDDNRYFQRLHPLLGFLLRQAAKAVGTPVGIPEWYLATSLAEILEKTQQTFNDHLQVYSVQIEP